MCGLAGLVCGRPGCNADHAGIVRRMRDEIAHRGPDDRGLEQADGVVLGSRRLAIIDLSPAGHMPMVDPTGRYGIAYNGEVYNFAEIRDELVALGHRFRSTGDTEVVLHAWMEWGKACLVRLCGIFAFALHDRETNEVVLVRDHYGIKPLYYTELAGHILFASEMKTLVRATPEPRVDRMSLVEWSLYRNLDAPTRETLIEGVHAVLPGEVVTVRGGRVEHAFYYRATDAVDEGAYRRWSSLKPHEVVGELDEALRGIVRQQLVSDVPVGTLLSGGLDSSLITAMSARFRRDLKAFHVSVAGFERLDERPYAEAICRREGIELVAMPLDGRIFRANLPHVTWLSDLPLTHPNSVAYHLVSKVARAHGVIVALSGEGADELFGGYSWAYRRKRRLQKLRPWLERLPAVVRETLALLVYAEAGLPVTGHRFRDLLPPAVEMIDRYQRYDWEQRCEAAYGFVPEASDRAVLGGMLADLSDFLTPLLRRLDRTSMGASVECRVPFLDPRLVHRAVNLPLDYKVGRHADKWVLKQVATRYMPHHLVFRRKMGFPLPLADYIAPLADRSFFAGGFCETVLGYAPRGIERLIGGWRRWVHGMFGLITLEMWGRIYLMGESVEAVQERVARLEPKTRGGTAARPAVTAPARIGGPVETGTAAGTA